MLRRAVPNLKKSQTLNQAPLNQSPAPSFRIFLLTVPDFKVLKQVKT